VSLDGILTEDYKILKAGFCPGCGNPIAHYWGDNSKPWCKDPCWTYYTYMPDSGWICRHSGTIKEYNDLFRAEAGI
jgi:hypothetical protein